METAVISYRVADFLKNHPPFNAVDEEDLLALAAGGRVRFHEPHEYILWQGEPHRMQVFVIQQGTVSLWDESGDEAELRDVRGAGDMLGIERFNDAPKTLYSARSESDVVIYAFAADDFLRFVLKYPHAAQYVAAEAQLTPEYQAPGGRREPHRTFLHAAIGQKPLTTCRATDTMAAVAGRILSARAHAVAVLDADSHLRAVLTGRAMLEWVAAGGGDAAGQTVESLLQGAPVIVGPEATVADGVLAMGDAGVSAIAITADGTPAGRLQNIVTSNDLSLFFGDQPAAILRAVRMAGSTAELRDLNQRARALTLEHLSNAAAVDWLAHFTHVVDAAIVTRLLVLVGDGGTGLCWCFAGSSGRGESLTRLAPHLVTLVSEGLDVAPARAAHQRVLDAFTDVGYLPRELPFDAPFYVDGVREWVHRYREWVRDPVMHETQRARTLFDLRPVLGVRALWTEVDAAIRGAVNHDFLNVLAHDCLASLPPLTFYRDAVVTQEGEQSATFRLERSAVRPLVDVGRVFGLAGGVAAGRSTLERFAATRDLLPDHEQIFREAADAFRVVLWQQGRVGIAEGTSGAELPPALLSRYDRQVLKGGFRSISRLIEFTADRGWLDQL